MAQKINSNFLYRMEKLNEILLKIKDKIEVHESFNNNRVSGIIHFIHDNISNPKLSVKYIKQKLKIKNNNISMLFKYEMGIGIRTYIKVVRIKCSEFLISNTDIEIYLISQAVCYRSYEHFVRDFKNKFGKSPKAFRKEKGKVKTLSQDTESRH